MGVFIVQVEVKRAMPKEQVARGGGGGDRGGHRGRGRGGGGGGYGGGRREFVHACMSTHTHTLTTLTHHTRT